MHLESIPRFSLPARFVCIDLLSRLESGQHNSNDMRHAVAMVSSYMLDPKATIPEAELKKCIALVEQLYLP